MKALAVAALAAFLLSSFITAWAVYGRFTETNANRRNNAQLWHVVICDIERSVLNDPHSDPQRVSNFLKFYDRLLVTDVHAAPCGLEVRP